MAFHSETIDYPGRLPPQNVDAEMAVIASVCLFQDAFDTVGDLRSEHFYAHQHQLMWQAILDLREMNRGVDAITLAERLAAQKLLDDIGNIAYIGNVLDSVPNGAHAAYYADLVRDAWLRRTLAYGCTEVLELIYAKSDTDEITRSVEKVLGTTVEQTVTNAAIPMRDIVLDVWHEIQGRKQRGEEPGIPTGFHNLDRILQGWKPDQLIVLAARPSMGKSALAAQLAERLAVGGLTTLFLSLEMSRIEIAIRLLASTGRISSTRLISSELLDEMETEDVLKACGQLQKLPIFIDDRAGRKVRDILAQARMMRRKHQLGAIFIDYLQLIEPDDPRIPREQQVATNMRQLKHLAKELHLPVIVLAQLNRAIEAREDKRPRLSDLRESGSIEQDADVVMFLHRPEAFDPKDRPGEADLAVAKNRNGPTGIAHLSWLASRTQFADLATPSEIAAERASQSFPAERKLPIDRDDPQHEWRTFSGPRDR